MTDESLSQDEVDALLKGVISEPEAIMEDADGVRPYNLATQQRVIRGGLPTLEVINQRFVKMFRVGLTNFIRKTPEITSGPARVIKYSEFIRTLNVPANFNLVQMKPLRGTALFIFDPSLVFAAVENLFGGDGRFNKTIEERDFTPTEHRIIQRLLEVAFLDYARAWSPVFKLSPEYVKTETSIQFSNIAAPNEVVVVTTFKIEFGSASGEFHICFPYSSIEPIHVLLDGSAQSDPIEPDARWTGILSEQVQVAEVDMSVTLTQIQLTIDEVLNMKLGDVISLEIPRTVTAKVDGIPVFECTYGESNGRYALKVESILSAIAENRQLGEHHA